MQCLNLLTVSCTDVVISTGRDITSIGRDIISIGRDIISTGRDLRVSGRLERGILVSRF